MNHQMSPKFPPNIYSIVCLLLLILPLTLPAQIKHALRDTEGRHIVPRGFVVTTNDGGGEVFFTSDDYTRMARMGSNVQVLRLELGKLSTFPGCQVEEGYLEKLDSLVVMGRNMGIKTVFKMTVYGVNDFSWEAFWLNQKREHQTYLAAWKLIWNRYKNNSAVIGYDLVNEPQKLTMDITYDRLTNEYLLPLYRFLIDEYQQIDNSKYCLIQSIFMNKGEAINYNQYAEIKTSVHREKVIFSPHIYQEKIPYILPTMARFDKEAALQEAPILIGEWGFPTFDTTDSTMTGSLGQLKYQEFYIRTAEIFDSMGVGSIKAWFAGNRKKQHFLPGGPSTWAIFSDANAVGTVERKYITDIIARPYPQVIAGDIHAFRYDFATRSLDIELQADNSKGASKIFIGADRHYPDGFTIMCNDELVLSHNPLKPNGLIVQKSNSNYNPTDVIWNDALQQLVILTWPVDKDRIHLKIVPGCK